MASSFKLLADRIRSEGGIKGADVMTGTIMALVNAVTREYTGRRQFEQLYNGQVSIVPAGAGLPTFALPANLQRLDKDNILYTSDATYENSYGLLYSSTIRGSTDGQPNRVRRVGANLLVYPYSDIDAVNSFLYINYWRYPTDITSPSGTLEIPELEEVVIKETIGRMLRSVDSAKAREFITDANRSYGAIFGADY